MSANAIPGDNAAVAVKWGLFLPVAALNSPHFTATYLGDELEGAEEDGVGGGFAEPELVTGVEPSGAAGLDLGADVRRSVYHHGSVGGRQVLDVPDILVIAPYVGMASRDVIAHISDIALPRRQRADLDALLARLNPARGAHHVAVLHAQQSQRMRRRRLVLTCNRRCAQRARRRRVAATGRMSAAARPTWN